MAESTKPTGALLSWEAYCEALGIDASDARGASLVRALHAELRHISEATARSVSHAAQPATLDGLETPDNH